MESGFTLCVVGLGLMGGSLALALRAASQTRSESQPYPLPARIVAVGRNAATLSMAQAARAIDDWTHDLAAGVADADVVILATPVRTTLRLLPEVGRHARPGALVMDLGSSKAEICAAMAALPEGLEPIGGHPMCGKEVSGFAAAEATLFVDRPFVLCPLPRTSVAALERAVALVQAIGARPLILDPVLHDWGVAAISHLPYAVAVALVNAVDAPGDPLPWSLAASGFRDTTRVAASDVEMMLDILLTNQAAILEWLQRFADQMAALQRALAENDEERLRTLLSAARERRSGLRL
ncbi:MAG: prephenate dehydrogenase/arogenate dehydrogenase family protein [Anaerolineae bacterium]|nr:prephenate dehydrogenase/arogenate dehydrogenase family protein [Anaerolineae bacterium]MDW8067682.1 prephenate dehydrogenase/arogenate dehydrogenase family protein [Anaerolineae bacterium]